MRAGPHITLESLAKTWHALPPQDVNGVTVPSAGAPSLGMDLKAFAGDLYVEICFGALAGIVTVQLQTAPQDADGSVPETGDFTQAVDSAGANIAVTYTATDDGKIFLWRVDRHLLKRWARIQVVGPASANLVGVVFKALEPQYEDQQSDRVAKLQGVADTLQSFAHFK